MGSNPAGRTTYRGVISNRRGIAVKSGGSKGKKPYRLLPRCQPRVVHVEGANVVIPKPCGRLDDVLYRVKTHTPDLTGVCFSV